MIKIFLLHENDIWYIDRFLIIKPFCKICKMSDIHIGKYDDYLMLNHFVKYVECLKLNYFANHINLHSSILGSKKKL